MVARMSYLLDHARAGAVGDREATQEDVIQVPELRRAGVVLRGPRIASRAKLVADPVAVHVPPDDDAAVASGILQNRMDLIPARARSFVHDRPEMHAVHPHRVETDEDRRRGRDALGLLESGKVRPDGLVVVADRPARL